MIVEGVLKLNEVVDSICVVVRSDQSFATAIIVPDHNNLIRFSEDVVGKQGFSITQICQDDAVKASLCKRLLDFGLLNGLEKFEIPKKVWLCLDEWTPESGLVTAAMKLKRKEIGKRYAKEVHHMYTSNDVVKNEMEFLKSSKISPV